ncbi:MAG: glycerol-3-phosphate acyltransferase, partial [Clostridia bacterium]|nr:glycerol-3-phosphate acyltransferase [Clostridia bacterium]
DLAKIKRKDLKKEGTGNLGATNTTLVLGKAFGFAVMILDVFKGFLTVKMSALIVPDMEWFAMLVGFFAIIGHCFPFYLKFKGGKGLATFGGVILAYDPLFFLFVVASGVVLVLIVNSGTALAYYAALTFPTSAAITSKNIPTIAVCIIMALFVMIVFIPNLKKAIKGEDHKSRDFLKNRSPKSK